MNHAAPLPDDRLAQIHAYLTHGWKLCLISPGKKSPVGKGWNRPENALTSSSIVPPGYGVGLLHAYSNTCAFDIDDLERATGWLAMRGVYLPALLDAPDAVQIVSGKPNRAKLVYALPSWASMPSKKIIENGHVILEFRCATANGLSVQDVLPPSLHPATGQPYRWAGGGDWHALATLPEALAMLWHALLVEDCHHPVHAPDGSETADWPVIVSALDALDPDCDRQTWIEVGMALHSVDGEQGFKLWDEWSSRGAKYDAENEQGNRPGVQWKSFRSREGGITLGSLFHHAENSGWKRPPPDISKLFSAVTVPHPVHAPDVEQSDDDAPLDPFDDNVFAPPYVPGQLPAVYEEFVEANFRFHARCSREIYAGMILAAVANHLPLWVQVEEKPRAGRNGGQMMSIVEQCGIVGPSTRGKSKSMAHILDWERGKSGLIAWQDENREHARGKIAVAKAAKLMQMKTEGRSQAAIDAALDKLEREMPLPAIVQEAITDVSIIHAVAANNHYGLPSDVIVDEWDNIFGGSAYRKDDGSAMTIIMRKGYDGTRHTKETRGSTRVDIDAMFINLTYDCVPSDMAQWRGYERALANGTLARQSVYAPGEVFKGERPTDLDRGAIDRWRAIQAQLRKLGQLRLYLADDPDLDQIIDEKTERWARMADNGSPANLWLVKTGIRCARLAAALYLVDALSIPTGSISPLSMARHGEITIPADYRRRAWNFLIDFGWSHQAFVHNTLIPGATYQQAAKLLLGRINARPDKRVWSREDLIGDKASRGVRGDLNFLRVLLFGYHFFEPLPAGRKKWDQTRPETAFHFGLMPGMRDLCAKHKAYLDEAYSASQGRIKSSVKRRQAERSER